MTDTTDHTPTPPTAPKKKKPGTFQKGDARINRKGRPKSADEFRGLALEVLNEIATDKAGNL